METTAVTVEHAPAGRPFTPLPDPRSGSTIHRVNLPRTDCTELVRDLLKYVTLKPGDQIRLIPVPGKQTPTS